MTNPPFRLTRVALLYLCVLASSLVAQQSAPSLPYQLAIGFSGDVGPDDALNPATVLYRRWPTSGTLALGFINYRHPTSLHDVAVAAGLSDSAAAELLSALDSCALVRHDSTGYRVMFAVFDDDVWSSFDTVIAGVAEQIRSRITTEVLPSLATTYSGSRLAARGIPFAVAAPVLIAALGLDERAIQQLEQAGMVHIRVAHPGGRRYGVLAQRTQRRRPRVSLWGIHGMGRPGVMLEVFGDNGAMNARRREIDALPDLAWNWSASGRYTPSQIDSLVTVTATLATQFGNEWFTDTDVTVADRARLEDLGQAGLLEAESPARWRLAFPVIEAADVARFEPLVAKVAQIAVDAMVANERQLASAYARTVPAANEVPMAEALNLVYHTTYSMAFAALLSEQAYAFARELGSLRYTAYAIQH